MNYEELARYVVLAKEGDNSAFTYLYEQTYHIVYNIACTALKDEGEAKDVLTEVYLRAFKNINTLRDDRSFVGWLIVITKNTCSDHKKEHEDEPDILPLFPEMLDTGGDPVLEWEQRENVSELMQKLIGHLPEAQQRAVYYYYFKQLSIAQTAALENCPIGTIKTRLYHARESLREAILSEERRTGDKYHLPVAVVTLASVMALPQVGFVLTAQEAATILASVLATLGIQYTGEDAAKVYTVIHEDDSDSLFKKSYLIKLKPFKMYAAILLSVILIAALCVFCYAIGTGAIENSDKLRSVTDGGTAQKYSDTEFISGGVAYTYTVDGDSSAVLTGARVVDVTKAAELVIPSEIDGHAVKCIGDGIFKNNEVIESVVIPAPVEYIGAEAFFECTLLKSVDFPDTLTSIGAHAFSFCHKITELRLPASLDASLTFTEDSSPFACMRGLDEITVEEDNKTMRVEDNVLYTYDLATLLLYPADSHAYSYTISSTVTRLGAYSFCSNHITSLTIPTSVRELGPYALAYCYSITTLKLINSITVFGENSLAMPNLEYIYAWASDKDITQNIATIYSLSGVIYSKEPSDRTTDYRTVLVRYPAAMEGESYRITSNYTKRIGEYAFWGSDKLTSLSLNSSVDTLERAALAGMKKLCELRLSDSITYLPELALAYNPSITSYTLPRRLESLDATAFAGCDALTSIVFTGEVIPCPEEDIVLAREDLVFYYPADIPEWADSEWAERYTLIADDNIVSMRSYVPDSDEQTGSYRRTIWVDRSSGIPDSAGGRLLTDEDIKAMSGMAVDDAAEKITTLADAYAWLKSEGYNTYGMEIDSYSMYIYNSVDGEDSMADDDPRRVSWCELSTILCILLDGDYSEVGTVICAASDDELPFKYIAFTYVKAGSLYCVTDPIGHLENSGTALCRAYTLQVDKLDHMQYALEYINGELPELVTVAAYPLTRDKISYKVTKQPFAVTFPQLEGVRYLYGGA